MIQFKSIEVVNFMRWSNLQFTFKNSGLILIEGKNGRGKSSIFESIVWGLYGVTLRGLSADEVVSSHTGKDCMVKVNLSVGTDDICIIRYRKHKEFGNGVYLFINDKDERKWDNKSTQEQINSILNMNKSLFINSVLFGQGVTKLFVSLSDSEQKELIENILNISIYEKCLEVTKEKLKNNENELKSLNLQFTTNSMHRDSYEKKKISYQKMYSEFEDTQIKAIKNLHIKKEELQKKCTLTQKELKLWEEEIKESSYAIKELQVTKSKNICYSCKQFLPFKDDIKIKQLENLKYQKEMNLAKHSQYLKSLNRELKSTEELIQKENDVMLKNIYKDLLIEIEEDIIKLNQEFLILKEKIVFNQKEFDLLKFWLVGFGNRGIKSYIFDSILEELNVILKQYCSKLTDDSLDIRFSTVSHTLSGESRDKFSIQVSNFEGHCSHKGSSGGERRYIDLCILWALQEFTRRQLSQTINIEFYDEIFDVLDSDSIDRVFRVLRSHSVDRAVYIISHNEELKGHFDYSLKVEKQKGLSRLLY